jgi:Fe-S-cluster containining protein
MSMTPEELCRHVLDVLEEAEAEALRFGRAASLACPVRCGDCCRDDRPEDSVLAALPAAYRAVEQGMAGSLAAAAAEEETAHPCVFYEEILPEHCTIYSLRPLVCRLFGFAGRRDKHGRAQFSPCRRMTPPAVPVDPAAVPVFSDFAARLEGLYPPLGSERRGLNAAFHRAAQWLLLRKQYEMGSGGE